MRLFILLLLICLIAGGASWYFGGPVPGDILATTYFQELLSGYPSDWAIYLTRAAKPPYLMGTLRKLTDC